MLLSTLCILYKLALTALWSQGAQLTGMHVLPLVSFGFKRVHDDQGTPWHTKAYQISPSIFLLIHWSSRPLGPRKHCRALFPLWSLSFSGEYTMTKDHSNTPVLVNYRLALSCFVYWSSGPLGPRAHCQAIICTPSVPFDLSWIPDDQETQ